MSDDVNNAANLLVQALQDQSMQKMQKTEQAIDIKIANLEKEVGEKIQSVLGQVKKLKEEIDQEKKKISEEAKKHGVELTQLKKDLMQDASSQTSEMMSSIQQVEERINESVRIFEKEKLEGLQHKVDKIVAKITGVGHLMANLREELTKK